MRSILSVFAKSPFNSLNDHIVKVKECSDMLRDCINAYSEEDFEKAEKLALEISKVEREADDIKNAIRDTMPKSIFMPVDRGDFLDYLKEQDKVADGVEEAALTLTLTRVSFPEELKQGLIDLTEKACGVVDVVPSAVESLNYALQFSFARRDEKGWEYIRQLDLLEREADHAELDLRRNLFQAGDKLTHEEFYLLMKVAKILGQVADHAENCGDRMRVMLAKQ
ncbi:MAG: TIGR00153 family protein [Candidatus Hydrothermarchaeaceae archaeon]